MFSNVQSSSTKDLLRSEERRVGKESHPQPKTSYLHVEGCLLLKGQAFVGNRNAESI